LKINDLLELPRLPTTPGSWRWQTESAKIMTYEADSQ